MRRYLHELYKDFEYYLMPIVLLMNKSRAR